uniref:Uncharacterized protein n=1 Tax=Picea glauca TaxID=3330 RepID=A0A101LW46_PICGL|nr:hypothetical protein ABT39_MTgene1526 [Picea glauca]
MPPLAALAHNGRPLSRPNGWNSAEMKGNGITPQILLYGPRVKPLYIYILIGLPYSHPLDARIERTERKGP